MSIPDVLHTPIAEKSGNVTYPWLLFFNSLTQVKQGTAAAMPVALPVGVIYYQTDTGIFYVGFGTGMAKLTGVSAAWGGISGVLSNQADLQAALNLKAPLANPSFTGVVKIGASDLGVSRIGPLPIYGATLALGNGSLGDASAVLELAYLLLNGGSVDFGYGPTGANHNLIVYDGHSDPGLLFKGNDLYGMKLSGTALQMKSNFPVAWSNDVPYNATLDLWLARGAAGILNIGATASAADGTARMNNIRVSNLTIYANNAAAITGGLAAGDFYRNGANPDLVCVVH